MAFDIFKNFAGPAIPSKEMPDLRLPQRHTPDLRPHKPNEKIRSFSDELQATSRQETAKLADSSKKVVSQASEAAKDKLDAALRTDGPSASAAPKDSASKVADSSNSSLSKVATEHRDEILSSPVAALLSSPSVQPQDLEALAQQNKILSDLLLGDASLVMDQPIDAADLVDALGLGGADSDLLAGLQSEFGEDVPEISPASLFAAAGINPQQVLDRLNALRGQFVEGSSESQLINNDLVSDELSFKNPASSAENFANSRAIPTEAGTLSKSGRGKDLALPTLEDGDAEQIADPLSGAAEVLASGPKHQASNADASGLQDGTLSDSQPISDFKEFKSWRDSLQAVKDPAADLGAAPQQAAQGLRGQAATFDGFHQMGERLDRLAPNQVTKIDMSQVATEADASVQGAPTPRFLDAVVSRFAGAQQAGVTLNDGKPAATPSILDGLPMQQVMDEAQVSDTANAQRPLHFAKSVTAELQQTLAGNGDQLKSNLTGAAPRKFTVEELMADVTAGRINMDFVREDASSFAGGDGGGDLSKFAKDGMPHVASMMEKPQAFGSEFASMLGETKEAAKTGMTPGERAEAAQKIMDSATYIMRQGTGSVRLDLSNSIYGPLEVAINMVDDKVDIRVFTDSDPVREAMIADLSRLKEALQTQNVNLNNVEVGVGQQHAGSKGSDQNGQFAQQQDWREAFAQNMVAGSRSSASNEATSEVSAAVAARRLNQMTSRIGPDGRLQVRI